MVPAEVGGAGAPPDPPLDPPLFETHACLGLIGLHFSFIMSLASY